MLTRNLLPTVGVSDTRGGVPHDREGVSNTHVYRGTSLIKNITPYDPTVGQRLGPYAGPRGVALSYEQGTPVGCGC